MKSQSLFALVSLVAMVSAVPSHRRKRQACAAPVAKVCTTITTTVLAPAASTAAASAASTATEAATSTAQGANVQAFTGTLGGAPPPVISSAGDRPFSVNGDTFVGINAALGRSCDVQHNACANAANSGKLDGGVSACDQQNNACHQANSLRRRAAVDLGSCSDTTILFKDGLDGRNQAAFIAENQQDFNHGSALNIAVIAGFICQRLESTCKAPSDTAATCSSASAAAVATTQNQAAADAFNAILGGGAAAAPAAAESAVATPAPSANLAATPVASATVVTITACA